MNIQALIEELNAVDEHARIEAKTGGDVGTSLLETISAFSNEPDLGGGHILLGLRKDEYSLFPTYTIVGVDDPDKLSADISTQCAATLNRPVRPVIKVEKINEQTVIGIFVPEAQPGDKPVFLQRKGLPKGAYRRIGSTDQQCTEDDLLVLYEQRSQDTFDAGVCADADLDDLDSVAIADYRRSRAEAAADAEELRWSDSDLLRALGCVRENRGAMQPTVAGILLFGKSTALRRLFPMMRVDYIRINGRDWVRDPDHRFDTVELRYPLMQLIRRALSAILDDLPKSFSLPEGSLQRTDEPVIPPRVLREAIVNAVMHRTYRVHGAVQIIRYTNRIEIRNPGYSLVSEEKLGEPGSKTRNPKIAAVLHETRFAETKGSGIRVMRELMKGANLAPPTLESNRDDDEFVATFLFHHFLGEGDLAWLARFRDDGLSDEEAKSLVFVREAGAIDNAVYRSLNGVDTLNASGHLRRLRDHGLLDARGKGAATYYVPGPKLLASLDTLAAIGARDRQTLQLLPNVRGKRRGAANGARPSGRKRREPGGSAQRSRMPASLQGRIRELKSWVPGKEFENLLWELCRWRPHSVEELSSLTGRQKAYLVRHYLTPMLKAGRLAYTIPETPIHPRQSYRAVAPDDPVLNP